MLGRPRLHLREIGSTNERARELAMAGAPHGTLVTATHQVAGRGRQGRTWTAPAGRTLSASLVLRELPPLLPLGAAVAVAKIAGPPAEATIKWPNDVLVEGRKVAGILVEGRPQEGWAVLGIGVNVAMRPEDFPEELRSRAGTLGRQPGEVEAVLAALLDALTDVFGLPADSVLEAWRARDRLAGREVAWAGGSGTALGVDGDGRLRVRTAAGETALDAGEVHLAG